MATTYGAGFAAFLFCRCHRLAIVPSAIKGKLARPTGKTIRFFPPGFARALKNASGSDPRASSRGKKQHTSFFFSNGFNF
jgi:hypothetical protein